MKRRDVLKMGMNSLALSSLGMGALTHALAAGTAFNWSRASFAALVSQQFWLIHPVHRAVPLTLALVRTPESKIPNVHAEQFSLIFSGAARPLMGDGSYEMDHPAIGRFLLHLSPVGANAVSSSYRADFNRIL